jgi:hypothetical protein
MAYHFCTYFDSRYLLRGLALYRSLRQHCERFSLWVLCMDQECYDVLLRLNLENVTLIHIEDFEANDKELSETKSNRTLIEYFFTCTPSLPLFVLERYPEVDLITYLDADLFFFGDPFSAFSEIRNDSVAITAHRFSPNLRHMEQYGKYNVGLLSFRRDAVGIACLQWWRERCIEWCFDRVENGRYADQRYLDDWPTRFRRVVTLSHAGINLAPWNLSNHNISIREDQVWVDHQPLVCYHFHGLRHIESWLYDSNLTVYEVKPSTAVSRGIYGPYIKILWELAQELNPLLEATLKLESIRWQLVKEAPVESPPFSLRAIKRRLGRWGLKLKRLSHMCVRISMRQYLIVINGRVIVI